MTEEELLTKTKKSKKRKHKKTISFDEEIVTKDTADKIFKDLKLNNTEPTIEEVTSNKQKTKRKKQKKEKAPEPIIKKVKILKRNANKQEANEPIESVDELDPKKPVINTEESIRARKRRKHAKLIEDKKSKSELGMQQKCLSYLSLWKHNKAEWKFEKLKQIWLQQNMFDDVKIPEKFWDTLVEYFNQSKGKVRQEVLKAALKVIENTENESKNDDKKMDGDNDEEMLENAKGKESDDEALENIDTSTGLQFQRARTIIQHLQE